MGMFSIDLENKAVQDLLTILAALAVKVKYPTLTHALMFEQAQIFIKAMYEEAGLKWDTSD